jgi:prevent-host-death family protein
MDQELVKWGGPRYPARGDEAYQSGPPIMTHVGISALRDHLGKYLHLARGGEKVVVTDQGRPIAVLTGIEASAGVDLKACLFRNESVTQAL